MITRALPYSLHKKCDKLKVKACLYACGSWWAARRRRHLNYISLGKPPARRIFISYFNKAPPSFRDKQHYACTSYRKRFYNMRVPERRNKLKSNLERDLCMRRFLPREGRCPQGVERHVFFFSEWFLVSYPRAGREGYIADLLFCSGRSNESKIFHCFLFAHFS